MNEQWRGLIKCLKTNNLFCQWNMKFLRERLEDCEPCINTSNNHSRRCRLPTTGEPPARTNLIPNSQTFLWKKTLALLLHVMFRAHFTYEAWSFSFLHEWLKTKQVFAGFFISFFIFSSLNPFPFVYLVSVSVII